MHRFKFGTCLDEIAVISREHFNFVILIGVCRHGRASFEFLSQSGQSTNTKDRLQLAFALYSDKTQLWKLSEGPQGSSLLLFRLFQNGKQFVVDLLSDTSCRVMVLDSFNSIRPPFFGRSNSRN